MSFVFIDAENARRGTNFPVNVSRLYTCPRRRFPYQEQNVVFDKYEITIRLDSDCRLCQDIIDDRVMNIPFPNVVFKSPGMRIRLAGETPREAIGFTYRAEHIALLRQWNMLPDCKFMPLRLTPELHGLFNQFRKFTMFYPTLSYPGDIIDGICFR